MSPIDAPAPAATLGVAATAEEAARDARRVAEIERYGLSAARSQAPRPDLVALARLAAGVFDAPRAMIAFVDETHFRTVATVGFEGGEVPRSVSLCSRVLHDDEPLYCGDLAADPRYADSYPVTTGLARFYVSQQLVTPSGEAIGTLCVFDEEPHDLDDRHRQALRDLGERVVDAFELEVRTRELTAAVAELRRSNESLTAFAAQVSHDLRNPLAALSGNLEVLDDLLGAPEPDLDQARPLVGRAHRSADRMTRLIGEVLGLAEVGGALRPAHVDVRRLVEAVLEDLATDLVGATVRLGPLAPVVADPVQLRVVLQNLLSNAAKHTRPGVAARIEVTAGPTASGSWRLLVVDHGKGVQPRDRERVFEPYVRADTSVPGSGVGLATCRRIAHAHGGRIGLDETPGGGATVWFEIAVEQG